MKIVKLNNSQILLVLKNIVLLFIIFNIFGCFLNYEPKTAKDYYKRALKNIGNNAINDYSVAIRLDPTHSGAYFNRGIIHFNNNRIDLAINDFNNAIKYDTNDKKNTKKGLIYTYIGDAYFINKNWDLAMSNFRSALFFLPDSIDLNEKIKIAEKSKQEEIQIEKMKIIPNLTESIRKDPNNADLYFRRGYAYAYSNSKPEDNIDMNSFKFEVLCLFKSQTEDWNKAISDWETVLRINPNHSGAKKNLEIARKWRGY